MSETATRIVVLGAGFGGLELSSRLSLELGDRAQVTLIDRSDAFVFGFHKLDVMVGHAHAGRRPPRVRRPGQAPRRVPPGDGGRHRPRAPTRRDRPRELRRRRARRRPRRRPRARADPGPGRVRPRVLLPRGCRRHPRRAARLPGRLRRDRRARRLLQVPAGALRGGVHAPRPPGPARAEGRHHHPPRHADAEADPDLRGRLRRGPGADGRAGDHPLPPHLGRAARPRRPGRPPARRRRASLSTSSSASRCTSHHRWSSSPA